MPAATVTMTETVVASWDDQSGWPEMDKASMQLWLPSYWCIFGSLGVAMHQVINCGPWQVLESFGNEPLFAVFPMYATTADLNIKQDLIEVQIFIFRGFNKSVWELQRSLCIVPHFQKLKSTITWHAVSLIIPWQLKQISGVDTWQLIVFASFLQKLSISGPEWCQHKRWRYH